MEVEVAVVVGAAGVYESRRMREKEMICRTMAAEVCRKKGRESARRAEKVSLDTTFGEEM